MRVCARARARAQLMHILTAACQICCFLAGEADHDYWTRNVCPPEAAPARAAVMPASPLLPASMRRLGEHGLERVARPVSSLVFSLAKRLRGWLG